MTYIGVRAIVAILGVSAACHNGFEDTVIQRTALRDIGSPDDLAVLYPDGVTGASLSAAEGRVTADLQAKEWDPAAALILVHPKQALMRMARVGGATTSRVSVWLYTYKSGINDAWLGVNVGGRGIIDAGVRLSSPDTLGQWYGIDQWKLNYDELPSGSLPMGISYKLLASPNGQPLWAAMRGASLAADRVYDANTGEAQSRVRRPGLWPSISVATVLEVN